MKGQKRTVVCIDDDPDMITLIRYMLRPIELDFIGAVDGQQGLDAIRTSVPDLVLLDLMLPDIDGWQVYQEMRADDKLKDIPVIVVTAMVRALDTQTSQIGEVAGYMSKPLGPRELLQNVNRVLGPAM